jgi:hypothetical protein
MIAGYNRSMTSAFHKLKYFTVTRIDVCVTVNNTALTLHFSGHYDVCFGKIQRENIL